jgi:hypothetical protein
MLGATFWRRLALQVGGLGDAVADVVLGARDLLRRTAQEEGTLMKAAAIVLILLGFIAGCARLPVMQSSSPSASPTDRPDLAYKSPGDCEKAGRSWIGTSGVCL